jgi:thiol-disulfide isomerase/thioredoxin
MISLYPAGITSDYPKGFLFSEFPVENGKFLVNGKISNPMEVFLGLKVGGQLTYISGPLFIEPGTQAVTCNADSLRKIPDIHNESMLEYLQKYLSTEYQSLDSIDDCYKRGSLERLYLFGYAQKHPASYVALWEISRDLMFVGYEKNLDSAFTVLSDEIKRSETGKYIKDDLRQLALTDTGKLFPNINVVDLEGKSHPLDYRAKKAKYILIDFWFSHCGPCLQQFPDYVEMVGKFQSKGFQMIGISSDSTARDIETWKGLIKSKSLRWVQYRTGAETMKNLRITIAPFNFLLDSSGRIIAKDLGTKEVSDFLQANLN